MEFRSWGKTPRLFRDIVITEKIDGTNSAVIIEQLQPNSVAEGHFVEVEVEGEFYAVGAQSKNRLIFPGKTTDNYNFAQWVEENAEQLVRNLGVGHHFGEWWGKGIGKRYDVQYRVFMLFNTHKHRNTFFWAKELNGMLTTVECVPVLFEGQFSEDAIHEAARDLLANGSLADGGQAKAEGLCVYHTQSDQVYKFTFDNNDKGKWEALDASPDSQTPSA